MTRTRTISTAEVVAGVLIILLAAFVGYSIGQRTASAKAAGSNQWRPVAAAFFQDC